MVATAVAVAEGVTSVTKVAERRPIRMLHDRVPHHENRAEVELHSRGCVRPRERDLHALDAPRVEADPAGL